MKIEGPLSFQLVVYMFAAVACTAIVGAILGPIAMVFGLAAFFLAIAALAASLYELKMQGQQPVLLSWLSVWLSGAVVALVFFLVLVGIFRSGSQKSEPGEPYSKAGSSYRSES